MGIFQTSRVDQKKKGSWTQRMCQTLDLCYLLDKKNLIHSHARLFEE